jgi:hypothetical protein
VIRLFIAFHIFCFDGWALTLFVLTSCRFLHFRKYNSGVDVTAGPWPVYLRWGQSNWAKIGPLGQLIFSGHLGQQLSFLPCHSISTDNRLMKFPDKTLKFNFDHSPKAINSLITQSACVYLTPAMLCWRCHSNSVNTGCRLPRGSDVKKRKRRNVVGIDMIRNNRITNSLSVLQNCYLYFI